MAFGELQDEVSGMSDQTPAGLEQPLLEARQGPALDSEGQNQPAREIAEIVGDDAEQQAQRALSDYGLVSSPLKTKMRVNSGRGRIERPAIRLLPRL